ncbi:hypothetical protein [Deferrisoma palaeochoriense]
MRAVTEDRRPTTEDRGFLSMRQLDLFADADALLHRGWARLGRLDLAGAAEDLEGQERRRPGPGTAELREALGWIRGRLPEASEAEGPGTLRLCRALREGRTGCSALDRRPSARRGLVRALAGRFAPLARAHPAAPLAEGLPWAVFLAWAGHPAEAAPALEEWVRRVPEEPLVWLALGDARVLQGWERAGRAAYREGFGLAPDSSWEVEDAALGPARAEVARAAPWGGPWWAVGLYEAGWFPRYGPLTAGEIAARYERFKRLSSGEPGPRAFFLGLALSEPAAGVPTRLRATVRRQMREMAPEVFEAHLDRIRGEGS